MLPAKQILKSRQPPEIDATSTDQQAFYFEPDFNSGFFCAAGRHCIQQPEIPATDAQPAEPRRKVEPHRSDQRRIFQAARNFAIACRSSSAADE